MSVKELERIFHPRSIAVVGASENPMSPGNWFIQHLLDYGFRGQIYPITASQSEVFGIKAYPSLKDVPKEVDYIICCVPAVAVIDLLNDCPQKGVKGIHLYTGRFSETGLDEPAKLEQEILQRAKEVGVRMIGPNCMGMYHPKEGISFVYDLPKEGGSVGMFLQSGGASGEFIRNSALRGIRFSKVVSYGNALDLNECDYLEYFLQDSETKIIAAYIEGVKDGRRFFSLLKEGARSKPIVYRFIGRFSSYVGYCLETNRSD
jgi:acetyltransferase